MFLLPLATAAGRGVAADFGPDLTAVLRTRLLAPETVPADRDEAVRRLLAGGYPADVAALADGLRSPLPAAPLAVARGVADAPAPPSDLLPLILPLLRTTGPASEPTVATAVAAVAEYANTLVAERAADELRRVADDDRLPQPARVSALRASAAFTARRVAAYLVEVATGAGTPAGLQRAAAAALGDLSGEPDRGTSAVAWQQWWAGHANQSEADWRAYVLAVRQPRLAAARTQAEQAARAGRDLLQSAYYGTPDAARADLLLAMLRSPAAPFRELGAKLANDEAGKPAVTDRVQQRVRDLIGDDDPAVRRQAVATARSTVDASAGPVLVAQLQRERDPLLKVALMGALVKLQTVEATPALIAAVADPRPAVAKAAAQALGEPPLGMGRQIAQRRPDLARPVADALRRVVGRRPGDADVRAAAVAGLSAVADGQTFNDLRQALDGGEPRMVRVAALNGFGSLGDRHADDLVVGALDDGEPLVRYAAAGAMRTVGRLEDAEHLYLKLSNQETDASVRDMAWQALSKVLESASADALGQWVTRFPDSPEHRLIVRRLYGRALTAGGQAEDAAENEQEIAQTLVELRRPADAMIDMQVAVDYFLRAAPPGNQSSDRLRNVIKQMLDVQLAARQYAAAVDFAAARVRQYPDLNGLCGLEFQDEADRLKDAGDRVAALALIDAALAMRPPLDKAEHLRQIRAELKRP